MVTPKYLAEVTASRGVLFRWYTLLDLVSFPGDGNYLTFFCVQHHRPFLSPFSNPIQILLKIVCILLVVNGHVGDCVIGK